MMGESSHFQQNEILPQIEEWQNRPLSAVYPIVFIDAIHFSVRVEHIVKK